MAGYAPSAGSVAGVGADVQAVAAGGLVAEQRDEGGGKGSLVDAGASSQERGRERQHHDGQGVADQAEVRPDHPGDQQDHEHAETDDVLGDRRHAPGWRPAAAAQPPAGPADPADDLRVAPASGVASQHHPAGALLAGPGAGAAVNAVRHQNHPRGRGRCARKPPTCSSAAPATWPIALPRPGGLRMPPSSLTVCSTVPWLLVRLRTANSISPAAMNAARILGMLNRVATAVVMMMAMPARPAIAYSTACSLAVALLNIWNRPVSASTPAARAAVRWAVTRAAFIVNLRVLPWWG